MLEYGALGMNDQSKEAYFEQEALEFGRKALMSGQDPAELIYNIAKAKGFGGQPGVQAPQQQIPQAQAPIQPAPMRPAPQTAAAQVSRLQQGAAAAGTLNGGQAPSESLLSRVEEMNDEEFDKFWASEVAPSHR